MTLAASHTFRSPDAPTPPSHRPSAAAQSSGATRRRAHHRGSPGNQATRGHLSILWLCKRLSPNITKYNHFVGEDHQDHQLTNFGGQFFLAAVSKHVQMVEPLQKPWSMPLLMHRPVLVMPLDVALGWPIISMKLRMMFTSAAFWGTM